MKMLDTKVLRGVAFVITAAAFFSALDTSTKFASTAFPVAVVMWVRFIFQTLGVAVWMRWRRQSMLANQPKLQIIRGMLLVASSVLTYYSLLFLPVAEFTATMMLTPLVMTLVATVAMNEKMSTLRWLFVVGGFIGAMIVIRPGHEAFTWAFMLPLVAVISNSSFQLLTHRLTRVDSAAVTHFYTGAVGVALSTLALPFAFYFSWHGALPDLGGGWKWGVLLLITIFANLGHASLILGYSKAPVAALTPYLYVQIPFAVFAGWLVFGQTPDRFSVLGMMVIGLSGAAGTWVAAKERHADLHLEFE